MMKTWRNVFDRLQPAPRRIACPSKVDSARTRNRSGWNKREESNNAQMDGPVTGVERILP